MTYRLDLRNVYVARDLCGNSIFSRREKDLNVQNINHNRNNDDSVERDRVRFRMFHIRYDKMDRNFSVTSLFPDEPNPILSDNKFRNHPCHR